MILWNKKVKSHYCSAQSSLIFLWSKVLALPNLIDPTRNDSRFHNSPIPHYPSPCNSALLTPISLLFLKYTSVSHPCLLFVPSTWNAFSQDMPVIKIHFFTEIFFIFFIFVNSPYTSNISLHFLTYYQHSNFEYDICVFSNYIFILFPLSVCPKLPFCEGRIFSVAHSYPAAVFSASRTAYGTEWYSMFMKKCGMYVATALFLE